MNRLLLIVLCSLLYSCTTTIPATSVSALRNVTESITNTLDSSGYELSGQQHQSTNEVYVSGTSFSKRSGYGTAFNNDYWQHLTRTYLDSAYNNITYSIKYQLKKDSQGNEYVYDFELTNCSASKNYKKYCSDYGLVPKAFSEIIDNPDITIQVPDKQNTTFACIGGCLGATIILTIIILLL